MTPPSCPPHPLVGGALTLTSLLLAVTALTSPFPRDLEPINVVDQQHSLQYPGFQGLNSDNDTVRLGLDFQRMLRINHMLYIAARDHVFAINLSTSAEQIVPQQKITWKTKDVEKCTVRGKNSDECYNYIKVLVPRNDETLFACGTNAFNPTCRNYKMATLEQEGEEVVGQARCPFESRQSNVGLFAGGNFYSATMTDFLASDAVIYRSLGESSPVLRTVKYDSKWLREPHFLHAIEYGNYVYFFFSEIAVEYTTLGKVVFSRVARVCKNDNGGSPRVLEKYWTSFLKARLNCSVPGDSFFYFDVLQSLTNVLQINQRPAVVGVFTTQANSITGSAVCAFYMDDIEKAFNGKFKEQKSSESPWTAVSEDQVPKPRPGSCAGDGPAASYKSSTNFPDETLSFIKSYPLMDEAVPSVNDRPCFTRTNSRYKLTQIAVDTAAGPSKNHTVLFLGSEDGRVLKVLASTHPSASFGTQLLEEIDVYSPAKCNVRGEDRRILGLELDKDHHALFVAFSSCVIRMPLSRCQDYGTCKKSCLSSRDPYCIWVKTGTCTTAAPGFKAGFEQDIENGYTQHPDSCHDVLATTRNQIPAVDSAYGKTTPTSLSATNRGADFPKVKGTGPDGHSPIGGEGSPDSEEISVETEGVRRQPEADKSSHSVHYTLLIACVLVAFLLGAVLSGFLVSCYCNHSLHKTKRLGKDPEASIPHALSLRSLAKLNGLLDGQAKEDKLEVSSPKMYNSLLATGKEQLSNGNGRAVGGDLSHHHHHHHHHPVELSGLPTPDSTPELPIKSMKAFKNQWEKNQNCNNAKESKPACMSGSRPSSGIPPQVFPFSSALANGQALGGPLLPEERKIPNGERVVTQPFHYYPQKVVDVTALDELLKHLHEPSGAGGKSVTMMASPLPPHSGQVLFANRVQPQIPDTESAPYYSSSTLPRDSLTRRMDVPPDMPPPQSTLERASRHPSQRHSLVVAPKMVNGGGVVPRQHSFSHRSGHQPPPLLARMNSTGSTSEGQHPLIPNGYLSRQHSYSEQLAGPRAAIVRRASSLKPDVPPKPLFIPASSPISPQGKFNY
uniref:Sema domain, transmembrane domain (TM), and cytoplasmic domain, (semaphorin) 6Ca n=1 Tax=Lepisosteus oculatus TaxID=7918 RepID=W5MLZ9_LEPOC|nr:PREDICTED: semaphorin-6C isoform X1 [Lepisosteus oculatus]